MSNFLKKQSKKIIITILALVTVLIGIPEISIAEDTITVNPIYENSDRTSGEILQSDIKNGKKIRVNFGSTVKRVKYRWNGNIGGETKVSDWIVLSNNRMIDIPIDIYNNGKDVPLGILELSIATWDGSKTSAWRNIPFYVVETLAEVSKEDKVPPLIKEINFTRPEDNEKEPIKVKRGEGTFRVSVEDLGYNNTEERATEVYCIIGEAVTTLNLNEYSSKSVKRFKKNEIVIGFADDADIKLPNTVGTYYTKMYAIDGSNNPSSSYWLKFDIKDDIKEPVITLNKGENGLETQYIEIGSTYQDPGATATDDVTTNITVQVDTSLVNTEQVGEYKVKYTAKDEANNITTAERTVYVVDRTSLNSKIEEAERLSASTDFTEESRNALLPVIEEAKNKLNTSTQSELEQLEENIQNIINSLNVQTPLVDNVEVSTNKTIDNQDNRYYIKSGDTITITFNTTFTTIDTVENVEINGKLIDSSKIKLEKLDEFNYKLTYTFADSDNETADGFITYAFSVKKTVTVNGQEQISSSETRNENGDRTLKSNDIIFDKTAPVIEFEGTTGNKEEIYFGDTYTDNAQNNIIVKNNEIADVTISSDIDTALNVNKLGNNVISYTAVDKAGNISAPITRTIEVKDYVKSISLVDNGTKKEYEYGESIDLTKTNIEVEMASKTSNRINTLDDLKTYLEESLGENWNDNMFQIVPEKLNNVSDNQEITVNITAYKDKPVVFKFSVKVIQTENPDMPKPEDIEWKPADNETEMTYNPELKSYEVTYNGAAHKLEIDKTNIPNNVTIERYEYKLIKDADGKVVTDGNTIVDTGAINAGTYEVKVIFATTSTDYKAPNPITNTLTIKRAELSKTDFKVEENEYQYAENTVRNAKVTSKIDGVTVKTIRYYKVTGETAGVELEDLVIENTPVVSPINAGTYVIEIDADKSANYEAKTKLRVDVLKISKTNLDLSTEDKLEKVLDITKPEAISKYDGLERRAIVKPLSTVSGLGEIKVKYYKDGVAIANPINAGTYTIKISIDAGTNYDSVPEMEIGTFTIEKRQVTITADDKSNAFGDVITNPNTYLTYKLSGDSILTSDTDKIQITVKSIVIDNLSQDGKITSSVSQTPYEIIVETTITDEITKANYNIVTVKGKYTINKATYNLTGITIDNTDIEYTGSGISKNITGTLPEGIDVSYEYKDENGNSFGMNGEGVLNLPVNVGTYKVIATFTLAR